MTKGEDTLRTKLKVTKAAVARELQQEIQQAMEALQRQREEQAAGMAATGAVAKANGKAAGWQLRGGAAAAPRVPATLPEFLAQVSTGNASCDRLTGTHEHQALTTCFTLYIWQQCFMLSTLVGSHRVDTDMQCAQ